MGKCGAPSPKGVGRWAEGGVNPWAKYITSYLEKIRVSRVLDSARFNPTDTEVASILLVAATFVQTRSR